MKKKSIVLRLFLLILVIFIFSGVLFIAFRSSRADRLTTNEEYLNSLRAASQGRQLAGDNTILLTPTPSTASADRLPQSIMNFWLGLLGFK